MASVRFVPTDRSLTVAALKVAALKAVPSRAQRAPRQGADAQRFMAPRAEANSMSTLTSVVEAGFDVEKVRAD